MIKKKKFGTLYLDGNPVTPEFFFVHEGQEIAIGNTVPGKEIQFVWIDALQLYIADRCICSRASYRDLEQNGFVSGTRVDIDGSSYLCRILKVGAYPGAPNEWDTALDEAGDGNDLWHWEGAYFWGRERATGEYWATRGGRSARFRDFNTADYRNERLGFRPALVPIPRTSADNDVMRALSAIKRDAKSRQGLYDREMEAEWNYIESFIWATQLSKEYTCIQLRSLWTAFCLRYNVRVDSKEYRTALANLWDTLNKWKLIPEMEWRSFVEFCTFMSKDFVPHFLRMDKDEVRPSCHQQGGLRNVRDRDI